MKRNDIKALPEMAKEKLVEKRYKLMTEFSKARMEHKAGRLKNVRILSTLRDDIARVETVLKK